MQAPDRAEQRSDSSEIKFLIKYCNDAENTKLTKVQTFDRIPGKSSLKFVLLVAKLQNTPTLNIFIDKKQLMNENRLRQFRAREHPAAASAYLTYFRIIIRFDYRANLRLT